MARSAKIYDFTIQPGGSFTLLVEGSFYRIQSSTGALEVRRDGGSGVGPIYAGQGEREEEFKRLTIVDKSGAINRGFICVSDGSFVDDRVTGSVEVIDGGKNRVNSGVAFVLSGAVTGAAGISPTLTLWNPAGSGENFFVKTTRFSSPVTQAYAVRLITALGVGVTGPVAAAVVPKKIGTTSAALAYQNDATAFAGTAAPFNALVSSNLSANAIDSVTFTEPICISPGQGLQFFSTAPASQFIASAEFVEEVIL
jgi:hypothetical protein